jgi:hypothetical protein
MTDVIPGLLAGVAALGGVDPRAVTLAYLIDIANGYATIFPPAARRLISAVVGSQVLLHTRLAPTAHARKLSYSFSIAVPSLTIPTYTSRAGSLASSSIAALHRAGQGPFNHRSR